MAARSLYLVALAAACVLSGCSGTVKPGDATKRSTEGQTSQLREAGQGARENELTLAVIPKGTVHEFWKTVEEGARSAAEQLNVEIKWDGPVRETEHDKQRSIVDNMVSLGVDGIVLSPTDEKALQRPVKAAVNQGIPVVIFDSDLEGDAHTSFVATDNVKGGQLAAQYVVKMLGESGGKVAMLRYTEGSGSTLRREDGFMEVAEAADHVDVVDNQFSDGSTAGALSTATNMLNNHVHSEKLELDGVFASNMATALGMHKALKRLRRQGVEVDVVFVGFDSSKELVQGLQSGDIDALVVQNPKRMGYLAVETLVEHLRGRPVESFVDTGVQLVMEENLADLKVRELLGLPANGR